MPSLGELWRSRRWRYLLNLIDHLPSHTHYFQMMSQDEEYAEMILEAEARGAEMPSGKSLTYWTPEVGAIADLHDMTQQVRNSIIGSVGGTPPKFVPYTRPRTAIDRVRKRREWAQHRALAAQLVPQ